MSYDSFRHFADSWGLVYMFAVFIGVVAMMFLPGAAKRAKQAASIPLGDDHPLDDDHPQNEEPKS